MVGDQAVLLMNILSASAAAACVSKAWSIAFDSLFGNHISQALQGTFSPYLPSFLATFPDFVALSVVLVMISEKGQRQDEKSGVWSRSWGGKCLGGRMRGVRTGRKGGRRGGHTLLFFLALLTNWAGSFSVWGAVLCIVRFVKHQCWVWSSKHSQPLLTRHH